MEEQDGTFKFSNMHIGKGDDGVEVAGRSWITRTERHRAQANMTNYELIPVTDPQKTRPAPTKLQATQNRSLSFRVKRSQVLQDQFTPDQMKAQMEAAKAKVARWSRSFMIFQFYTVPGRPAKYCSPCHRMSLTCKNEGSECVGRRGEHYLAGPGGGALRRGRGRQGADAALRRSGCGGRAG
jgi:molybdenum cofactor biosynthesis enzyme MoaA